MLEIGLIFSYSFSPSSKLCIYSFPFLQSSWFTCSRSNPATSLPNVFGFSLAPAVLRLPFSTKITESWLASTRLLVGKTQEGRPALFVFSARFVLRSCELAKRDAFVRRHGIWMASAIDDMYLCYGCMESIQPAVRPAHNGLVGGFYRTVASPPGVRQRWSAPYIGFSNVVRGTVHFISSSLCRE